MKSYHITDRATWEKSAQSQLFKESHWIYLPHPPEEQAAGIAQKVLVVSKFIHEGHEFVFNNTDGVDPLPHLLSRRTLHPDRHVKYLKHAGVTESHSTFDAMELVSKHHGAPLHYPSGY